MTNSPESKTATTQDSAPETIISLRAVAEITRQRTHCVVKGEAMTLEEFEETHKEIVLGAN